MNDHPPPASGAHADEYAGVHALVAEVAVILGEPWSLDRDPARPRHRAYLCAPEGVELAFTLNGTRVAISGTYPPDPWYRNPRHQIGISLTRGTRVIAAEVVRRLLPVYLPDLRVAQARSREHEDDMRERAALLARLQLLLPGSIAPQGHAGTRPRCGCSAPRPSTAAPGSTCPGTARPWS